MPREIKYHQVNANLRKLRNRMRFTQEQFSAIIGISRSDLGVYDEHRAQVPIRVIKKLLDKHFLSKETLYDFMFTKKF